MEPKDISGAKKPKLKNLQLRFFTLVGQYMVEGWYTVWRTSQGAPCIVEARAQPGSRGLRGKSCLANFTRAARSPAPPAAYGVFLRG